MGVSKTISPRPVVLPRRNSPKPRGVRVPPSSWCSGPPGGVGVDGHHFFRRLRQVDGDVGGEQRTAGAPASGPEGHNPRPTHRRQQQRGRVGGKRIEGNVFAGLGRAVGVVVRSGHVSSGVGGSGPR